MEMKLHFQFWSCEGFEPYLVQEKSSARRNALRMQPDGAVVLDTLMVRTGPRTWMVTLLGDIYDRQEQVLPSIRSTYPCPPKE